MTNDALPPLVLHQFATSHFNEKARWALDWKGLPHTRVHYLPGPHVPAIRRLSGQSATPVLVAGGETIAGSAAIIDWLEKARPEPRLYPETPGELERARAIQAEFDRDVGPAVRTALFSLMIDEPDFLCATFSRHRGAVGRGLYRATFPIARRMMAKAHETDRPERVAHAFETTERALERVAGEIGPSGQLVGEAFSVADLTCAALLAPLVETGHPDMTRPEPVPGPIREFLARWADHPAARWVREQYARHRPAPGDRAAGPGAAASGR